MLRYPSINPDGTMISFSYQGDIWTAGLEGGGARRITIHEAYEGVPCWSPDGSEIAFSSNRFGNHDVFTIPAGGGSVKRLTWRSCHDVVTDWNSSSGILFFTGRDFRQVEWDREIHSVDPGGGTPVRFLDDFGSEAATSPGGRYTAFVRGACRIEREAYTGPANKQIWIYDSKEDRYFEATTSKAQDYHPKWYDANTLYYLSSEPGKYNVFSLTIDEKGNVSAPVQVTYFEEDGIRSFDVSSEGGVIVAEHKTGLYRISPDGAKAEKIRLDIGSDYRFDPVVHQTFGSNVDQYAVSPNGKYSAIDIHGEVFITENHKKKKSEPLYNN